MVYIHKMDSLSARYEFSTVRVNYYIQRGAYARIGRRLPKAIENYQKALKIAAAIRNEELIFKARTKLGITYGDMGDYVTALARLKEVEYDILESKAYPNLLGDLYGNIVDFYVAIDDIPAAYLYSSRLFKIKKTYGDSIMYLISRTTLLLSDKKYEEALRTIDKALSVIRPTDTFTIGQFNVFKATAYVELQRYSEALATLKTVEEITSTLKIESSSAELAYGRAYLHTGRYIRARGHFEDALKLADSRGILNHKIQALEGLTSVHKHLSNYQKALEYHEEYASVKDTVLTKEKTNFRSRMESHYQLKEDQKVIQKQQEINQLQASLLNTEYRTRYALIALAAVIFIFGFIAWLNFRRTARTNKMLVKQQKAIEEYSQRLKTANTLRDKLFAMLSHDLRSPVSSLVATLELARAKGHDSFLKIQHSLTNIQLILNNLLSWSDLQLREARPYVIKVDLKVLIASVLNQVQQQALDKQISLIPEYKHTNQIRADENYLQIVVRNVLTNALKFTPKDGVVLITTEDTPDAVKLTVRDSGIGIPPDKLHSIFSYPVSVHGTGGEKGTGLGLTLSSELLHKIQGKISVKSKVGLGTEITILLPLKKTGKPEKQAASDT